MGLGNFISGMRRRGEMLQQAQDEDSVINKVQQRKLTQNERLLNQLREKDRQEAIRQELARREEADKETFWRKDVITQPNLFTGSNGNSILKQQNLFGLGGGS